MRSYIYGSALIFMMLIIFQSIGGLGFSKPDDNWMLLNNPYITDDFFSIENQLALYCNFIDIQYSPLISEYYYLIYRINGFDPYIFHLFSILFHSINCCLIFILSKKTLLIFDVNQYNKIPYFVILIYAIHPTNIESIAWISATKILLFATFTFLTIIFFINILSYNKKVYYILSIICFFISCLLKEQALATLPLLIIMYWCFQKQLNKQIKWPVNLLIYFGTLALLTMGLAWITLQANSINLYFTRPMLMYNTIERFLLICYCITFYIWSSTLPSGLHYHYFYPFSPGGQPEIEIYFYPFVIIAIVFLLYNAIKKSKIYYFYLFCVLGFIFEIGMVLQIIPMTRPAIMSERYLVISIFYSTLGLTTACYNEFGKIDSKIFKYAIQISVFTFLVALTFYSHALYSHWELLNI
jgi:hypothetical protein